MVGDLRPGEGFEGACTESGGDGHALAFLAKRSATLGVGGDILSERAAIAERANQAIRGDAQVEKVVALDGDSGEDDVTKRLRSTRCETRVGEDCFRVDADRSIVSALCAKHIGHRVQGDDLRLPASAKRPVRDVEYELPRLCHEYTGHAGV